MGDCLGLPVANEFLVHSLARKQAIFYNISISNVRVDPEQHISAHHSPSGSADI
jgi:hypothetical protein